MPSPGGNSGPVGGPGGWCRGGEGMEILRAFLLGGGAGKAAMIVCSGSAAARIEDRARLLSHSHELVNMKLCAREKRAPS